MMRLDRLGSVFLADPICAARFGSAHRALPILMYHSVSPDTDDTRPPYYRVTTSPSRFRQQMLLLRAAGYEVLDLDDALRRLRDPRRSLDRAAVITFDDGFRDFYTHAWPVLDELGFAATVFLPTRFVGHSRRRFNGRECLTWSEVRALQARGVRFGAHTASHPELYRLPWPDIRRELTESRRAIDDETATPAAHFAYPFAFPQEDLAFVERLEREVLDAGFVAGLTTIIGRARPGRSIWLQRLPVNDADDPSLFGAKLRGAYDWVRFPQLATRRARMLLRKNARPTMEPSSSQGMSSHGR